ncbi:MAG: dihydroorotase [Clostridia bacterium]|nr:dihydroorotase [Clostridia bacterium]
MKMKIDNAILNNSQLLSISVSKAYEGGVFCPIFSTDGKYVIFPGLCDVHVHLREPGFSYKETIKTGTMAAARGGYSTVCSMPNLNPVPDSAENLQKQLDIIERDACINVIPYGSITKRQQGEELSDMANMADHVCAFSDDGRGVQNDGMMRSAMLEAKRLDKMIVAHCEVNSLLEGGYIHKGKYAAEHGHRGICSASEYEQIKRDIELVEETGVAYHVCHISCRESVEAIREAKKRGVDITCETGPHYLVLCDDDLQEDGRFKMNPPLRSADDREALIEGIVDGTVDMIATDHAPHSAEEKSRGLEKSAFGIVGIETAFSIMYTHLVKTGKITMERLCELMCIAPRERFGFKYDNSYSVFELETPYTVDPEKFASMGRSTPFTGAELYGRCVLNVIDGKTVYSEI